MNPGLALFMTCLGVANVYSADLAAAEIGRLAGQADVQATALLRDYTVDRRIVMDAPRFNKHAEMVIRVTYRTGQGKSIEVLSSKNAEGMQKRVFDRIIEAEKEASRQRMLDEMRIGPENYDFALIGTEMRDGHNSYVLQLKPKRKSKFLLEGRAWVSVADYGLIHVEGRPSQGISFWVGKPQISQSFCKVGPVWMLDVNSSTADVKMVGRSELKIDSYDFKVNYLNHQQVARAYAQGSKRASQ
jgi:hypothetical protein